MGTHRVDRRDLLDFVRDDGLELLLLSCPDAVVVAGEGDSVILFSGSAEWLFRSDPPAVLGKSASDLFAPGEFDRIRRAVETEGAVRGMAVRGRRADGSEFPASVSAARLSDRYGGAAVAIFVRDRTAQEELERELSERNERLRGLVVRLNEAAQRDPLTGLLHRGAGLARAEEAFLEARAAERPFAVVLFDLDHFKGINDVYGHLVGDRALRRLANVIAEHTRRGDIVARFGGEEFILFLPAANREVAAAVAERVRTAVARLRLEVEGLHLAVTVSAGVASVPECAPTLLEAIHVADTRLLAAKRLGRNRVVAEDLEEGDQAA
ncbi:putative diguanylate cyclase YedQ [bacterium HR29]|jgi:diguanylate cyclase (GGDEF)-like protein/PAS domain S-box-containing protein|nr:putative diguanylate cyclase YedQ [bacterium HR29]